MLEVSYTAIHGYAGSVGELLGVQLVSGIWMTSVGFVLLRRFSAGWRASLVSTLGILTGTGLVIATARIFEANIAAIQAFTNLAGLIWVVALGILMCAKARTQPGNEVLPTSLSMADSSTSQRS
jgi:hypothetical protein